MKRARRRENARAAGLCCICLKKEPDRLRTVCKDCTSAKTERKRRKRRRDREVAEFQQIIVSLEAAGDKARDHHLFENAVQRYREALSVVAIRPDDLRRLEQKLNAVSLVTSNPSVANSWHDRMLDSHLSDTEKAEQTVVRLRRITQQMWIDSKTRESMALREEAVRIAEMHGTSQLRKLAMDRLINGLLLMGRFDDAAHRIRTLGDIESLDNRDIRTTLYWRKGIIAAYRGLKAEAWEHFERTLRYVKDDPSSPLLPAVLRDYANAALTLGDIEHARALSEQALLIVRRNHLGWYVPLICMDYAHILTRMGRYIGARGYLLEALSSDAHAPILEEYFAFVGIPIALHLNDEATLTRCIRPAAVELAFQSGEPARIGPVAAVFARLYSKQGQQDKARTLLHRALEFVTYVDESIDLPLVVAQYGARKDVPSARLLLEKRLRFPSGDVAQACALLFDALIARRARKRERPQLATQAVEHFDRLHWYAYSDLARSLVPLPHPTSANRPTHEQPLSSVLPSLTERERQVVALVLEGQTNREISQQLGISENTVEKHMTSIMSRLGIRSRHQLVNAMVDTSETGGIMRPS